MIAFLNDAIKFVDIDIGTVNLAPLQIYCSLLVLAPINSIVRRTFTTNIPPWITDLSGQVTNWDARLRMFETARRIESIEDYMIFSQDSKLLIDMSQEHRFRIWGSDTGECIQDIEIEQEWNFPTTYSDNILASVSQLVSSDAKLLLVGRGQEEYPDRVQILDLVTGQVTFRLPDHRLVAALAFSQDSKTIWSCTWDGQVSIWNVATETCVKKLDCPVAFHEYTDDPSEASLVFSLKTPNVLLLSKPGTIDIWYLDDSESLNISVPEEHSIPEPMSISPDGRLLVTRSVESPSFTIWDLARRRNLWQLPMTPVYRPHMAFSPDSMFLAAVDHDEQIRIWDMRNGRCSKFLDCHTCTVSSIRFSPDTKYLILTTPARDGRIWVWDVNGTSSRALDIGLSYNFESMLFSPNGNTIALTAINGKTQLWNWKILLEEPPKVVSMAKSVLFSPNFSMVAALFTNGNIRIWDAVTGVFRREICCGLVKSIVFSPDSSFIAVGKGSEIVKAWNLHEPDHEWQFNEPKKRISVQIQVYFSPDSQNLAVVTHKLRSELQIWFREASTFKFKRTLWQPPNLELKVIRQLVFAHDSKLVSAFIGVPGEIRVWNLDTGHLVQNLPLGSSFSLLSMDIRPTNSSSYSIILAYRDLIEVRDLETCRCIRESRLAYVADPTMSSTGTLVVIRSAQVCIWDWATGKTLARSRPVLPNGAWRCCPQLRLHDFLPSSSIIRTSLGDFVVQPNPAQCQQAMRLFGVEHDSQWIQWRGHNIFKLPPELRHLPTEVSAIPGDSLGFTVAIGTISRGVVILRFSNERGMLNDLVSRI